MARALPRQFSIRRFVISAVVLLGIYVSGSALWYSFAYDKGSGTFYGDAVATAINRKLLLKTDDYLHASGNMYKFLDKIPRRPGLHIVHTPYCIFDDGKFMYEEGGRLNNAEYGDCLIADGLDIRTYCRFWWLGEKCAHVVVPSDVYGDASLRKYIDHVMVSPCSFLPDPVWMDVTFPIHLARSHERQSSDVLGCVNGIRTSDISLYLIVADRSRIHGLVRGE